MNTSREPSPTTCAATDKEPLPPGGELSDAFTPGPWQTDGNTNGNFYGVSAYREGFRGAPVVVWRGIAKPSSAEGRANARLIAAAPALLSHTRSLLALVLLKYGNLDPDVNRYAETVRGDLLKALGPSDPATSHAELGPGREG